MAGGEPSVNGNYLTSITATSKVEPQVATFTCDEAGGEPSVNEVLASPMLYQVKPQVATFTCDEAGGEPSVNGEYLTCIPDAEATSCYFYMRWLEESHL